MTGCDVSRSIVPRQAFRVAADDRIPEPAILSQIRRGVAATVQAQLRGSELARVVPSPRGGQGRRGGDRPNRTA